jgi:hypothetical protein
MENSRKLEPVRAESELLLHWNILVLLRAHASGARAACRTCCQLMAVKGK